MDNTVSLDISDLLYGFLLLLIVELKVHAIVDLVVDECDVVLVDSVPLLQDNLVPFGARLSRDQLFEVAHGVILVALDPHLLAQTIVDCDLNHCGRGHFTAQCP